eukprot:1142916-Pelagomonas_calceolata.AAC.1
MDASHAVRAKPLYHQGPLASATIVIKGERALRLPATLDNLGIHEWSVLKEACRASHSLSLNQALLGGYPITGYTVQFDQFNLTALR